MVTTGRLWWIIPFLFLVTVSCEKTQSLKGEELARVNDRVITLQEFDREMEQLPPYHKTLMISAEGRKEFLQQFIDLELLLQEGRKKGLDKDREILAKVEMFKKGLIVEALMEDLCEGRDEVSDDEVEIYYRENKGKFFLRERIRVRHIIVKTRSEAERIREWLNAGEDFITLAKRYSISPSSSKGGDLGYIQRGMVGKEFERAAFSLKRPGEMSDIIKTERGYNIIRLEDRKKPRQRAFSEVKEEIHNFLRGEKRREILTAYLKDLREKAQIVIHEELLTEGEEDT